MEKLFFFGINNITSAQKTIIREILRLGVK